MSDQSQPPVSNANPDPSIGEPGNQPAGSPQTPPAPTYSSWREQRRAERWARREARWQRRAERPHFWMVGGALLVLLGVVFLLQNMGVTTLKNWWALFILLPAYGSFMAGVENFQDHGRLTRSGVGALVWGSLFTLLALVFLFDLNINLFWPVLLIAGGVSLLVTALLPG